MTSLRCYNCIAFGQDEEVGSKRKAMTIVQGWRHPFRYDNIENHLRNQHYGQWALYQALESSYVRALFFDDVLVVFKNSCNIHACKTYIVHIADPTLINANQSFSA
jgi:hypothetical protein